MYADEYASGKEKFQTSLIGFEDLKRENIVSAIKTVQASVEKIWGIYRGWMLTPSTYELLYHGLLEKNIQLINSPIEYKFCHYLPESYEFIMDSTPKTTFKPLSNKFNYEDFKDEIEFFGNKAIIVKDYVKSQKHYWKEACFIPNASDKEKVFSVVNKFIELQDSDLNVGLVFREFVELEQLTIHSKSEMPLTKEFRLFVMNGEIIATYRYWDEGDYKNVSPVIDEFQKLIPNIKSNFFTMDIAKKKDGDWIIVELGDGQVAGLPDHANRDGFYNAILKSSKN